MTTAAVYTNRQNGRQNGHSQKQAPPPSGTVRLPPHSQEAEECVLGSLLIDPGEIATVAGTLQPDMFYRTDCRQIYQSMIDLWQRQTAVDFITVCDELRRKEQLAALGGEARIVGFLTLVPTSINLRHYAQIVQDKATRRRMIQAASKVANLAYDESGEIEQALNEAESTVLSVRERIITQRLSHAKGNAMQFMTDLDDEAPVGISTGYQDLDRCIGGLEPGNGYWFCASEKMGKTSFVNGISLHNALNGRVVLRLSLEMSAKQRTRRDISAITGIPINRLKSRDLSEQEKQQAYEAAGQLSSLALIIDETPGMSPTQMRASCNRVLAEYGRLDLVELDYFQLCNADKPTSNRVQDLEEISRSLVTIIKELNVPLIGTAQVTSKAIDQRNNKRPHLSDVFGSSALIKDGYFISFLFRDEYYNPDTTPTPNQAELIVRAHRDGDTPTIMFQFDGPTARFRDLVRNTEFPF